MGRIRRAPVDAERKQPKTRNTREVNMNSMVMSSRKALVARPTQSRKVASDEETSRQIDYLVGNGWAPCIEFASQEEADTNQLFFAGPALYENRYWTMWKLPMFGCQSGDEVLAEIQNCQDEYPGYRVRVVGFDSVRQCQMAGFICRK